MDIAYIMGEIFISFFSDRPRRRRRRSIAEINRDANEQFAATAPRAAARMAWDGIFNRLRHLAQRYGVDADDQPAATIIDRLRQKGVLDADFAGVLQSLAAQWEPGVEPDLSVDDARAIHSLTDQFAARLAAL